MANNVMSLQLKLTLLKNKFRNLIFVISAIVIAVIILSFSGTSCGINHILILNDLNTYEKTLDPEFCEIILEKIYSFNDQCTPQIEILDCG